MTFNLNFLESLIIGVLAMWKVTDIVLWLFLNVSIQWVKRMKGPITLLLSLLSALLALYGFELKVL
jgi:hypothetical protein